jgi:hypothetical protein
LLWCKKTICHPGFTERFYAAWMVKRLTGQITRLRWELLTLSLICTACSPRHLVLQGIAEELAHQGQAPDDDLVLAREASGFYLKLPESLLREAPDSVPLAEAVAGWFTYWPKHLA